MKDWTPFTVRTRVQWFQPFLDRTDPPRPEMDANVILRHIKKYVFAELTVFFKVQNCFFFQKKYGSHQYAAVPLQWVANQLVEWGGRFHPNKFKDIVQPKNCKKYLVRKSQICKLPHMRKVRKCKKICKSTNMRIFRGLGEDDSWKKPEAKKNLVTLSL